MIVEIKNFKHYSKLVKYEFTENHLNLLTGPSNCGKTTIFEAIYWVLYGSSKIVFPKGSKASNKNYTEVTLKLDSGVNIRRTKPPNYLEVNLEGGTLLEQETGQEWINNFFGTKKSFIATTYMRQKRESPLLEFSINEKSSLLQELTFGLTADNDTKESPQYYTDIVDKNLKIIKSEVISLRGRIGLLEEQYSDKLEKSTEYYDFWEENDIYPTEKMLDSLMENISKNEINYEDKNEELASSVKQWDEYKNSLEKIEVQKEALNSLKLKLQKIKFTEKELESQLDIISMMEEYNMKLSQVKKYKIDDEIINLIKLNYLNIPKIREYISTIQSFESSLLDNDITEVTIGDEIYTIGESLIPISNIVETIEDEIYDYESQIKRSDEIKEFIKEYNFAMKNYKLLLVQEEAWLKSVSKNKKIRDKNNNIRTKNIEIVEENVKIVKNNKMMRAKRERENLQIKRKNELNAKKNKENKLKVEEQNKKIKIKNAENIKSVKALNLEIKKENMENKKKVEKFNLEIEDKNIEKTKEYNDKVDERNKLKRDKNDENNRKIDIKNKKNRQIVLKRNKEIDLKNEQKKDDLNFEIDERNKQKEKKNIEDNNEIDVKNEINYQKYIEDNKKVDLENENKMNETNAKIKKTNSENKIKTKKANLDIKNKNIENVRKTKELNEEIKLDSKNLTIKRNKEIDAKNVKIKKKNESNKNKVIKANQEITKKVKRLKISIENAKNKYDDYFDSEDVTNLVNVTSLKVTKRNRKTKILENYSARRKFEPLMDKIKDVIFMSTLDESTLQCPECNASLELGKHNITHKPVLYLEETNRVDDVKTKENAENAKQTLYNIEQYMLEYNKAKELLDTVEPLMDEDDYDHLDEIEHEKEQNNIKLIPMPEKIEYLEDEEIIPFVENIKYYKYAEEPEIIPHIKKEKPEKHLSSVKFYEYVDPIDEIPHTEVDFLEEHIEYKEFYEPKEFPQKIPYIEEKEVISYIDEIEEIEKIDYIEEFKDEKEIDLIELLEEEEDEPRPEKAIKPEDLPEYEKSEILETDVVDSVKDHIKSLRKINIPRTDNMIDLFGDDYQNKIMIIMNNIDSYNMYKKALIEFEALEIVPVDMPEMSESKIRKEIVKIKVLKVQKEECNNTLLNLPILEKPKTVIKVLENELRKLKDEIKYETKLVEYGKKIMEVDKMKNEISSNTENMESKIQRRVRLDKIKKLIVETRSHALEETVTTINGILQNVAGILYNNSINFIFSMFKKLKTKDYTKPEPNIKITKGFGTDFTEYSYEDLSGGEKSRLTIAITLALSTIGTSPFIFVDEGFSSMDISLRNKCLKVFKEYSPDKTVINVCHGTVEGMHDNIVTINPEE